MIACRSLLGQKLVFSGLSKVYCMKSSGVGSKCQLYCLTIELKQAPSATIHKTMTMYCAYVFAKNIELLGLYYY